MSFCLEHFYNRPLPCPWLGCVNGSETETIEIAGHVWGRHVLADAFEQPLYLWAARGIPSPLEAVHLYTRATTQLNAMYYPCGDGLFYHFTGPAGVTGILHSGELWATEYRSLVDDRELRHSLEVAHLTIAGIEDELCADTIDVLDAVRHSATPDSCYVTSFSLKLDSEKHWLAYAQNETGGAFGLEPTRFATLIAADPFAVNVSRVVYRDELKKGIFHHLAMLVEELIRLDQRRGVFEPAVTAALTQHHFTQLLPLCKEWNYRTEEEARLVIVPAASEGGTVKSLQPRHTTLPSRQLTYVTTRDVQSSFELPIQSIVLGRHSAPDLLQAARNATASTGIRLEHF